MGTPPVPLERPPGADHIVVELPLPLSEQYPPQLPDLPAEPEPDEPDGGATIAT